MRIFNDPKELQQYALELKRSNKRIGLVPTMGYLHAGHLSLIDRARAEADVVIVSIFVNPIQFGPAEDLDKYPRNFERDCALCEEHGAAAIFAPEPDSMYPDQFSTHVEESLLSQGFCGALRPGHFRGVTTVVAKLFNLTLPDVAVFGQKDAQQALVIRRMVRDLDFPVRVIVAPLVRDTDGVALSSRNAYLSPEERERGKVLSRSLSAATEALKQGVNPADVQKAMRARIEAEADRVDYADIRDADTLAEPDETTRELILLAAAYFGKTRLIDNMLVSLKQKETVR